MRKETSSVRRSRLLWAALAMVLVGGTVALWPENDGGFSGQIPDELARVDDNPATDSLTTTCEVVSDYTPETIKQSGVQGLVPGEFATFTQTVNFDEGVVYQDILSRPDGSTYYASYLEHVALSSDLVLDPASVQFLIAPGTSLDPVADGVLQTVTAGTQPDPVDWVLETDTSVAGQTAYRLYFPGDETQMLADQTGRGAASYTVPAGGETFVLTHRAMVPTSAIWGEVHDGSECFSSVSTDPSNRDTDRVRTSVSVVLPELDVQKDTPIDNAYNIGATATYTLTVQVSEIDKATGQLNVAPARDVILTDEVPVGLLPLDAADAAVADGGTTLGGGIWNATARTITYELGDILPGATPIVIDEAMQIDSSGTVEPDDTLTNRIVGDISYLPGDDPNDTVINNAASDDASIVVASIEPTVSKEALLIPESGLYEDATPLTNYGTGLPYWYAVTVTVPPNSSYYNFTVFDTLPDGVVFNSYVSADCDVAAPTCPVAPTLASTVFAGGDTGIGWYPNIITSDPATRTYTLLYEVQLDSKYFSGDSLVFFDEFVNDVSMNWNAIDRLGAVEPSTASHPPYDGEVLAEDTIIYDRPVLTIDKAVETSDGVKANSSRQAWDYEIGDIATYTNVITNNGSSDAENITITDTPVGIDIDLSSVLVNGAVCTSCTLAGGVLTISLPGPIDALGGTATISYEAVPTQNGEIDNLVEIPVYSDPFGTPYVENPSDTVPLEIPDPVLEITKTAVDTIPATANTLGTLYPFTIEVENTGDVTAYNPVVTDVPPSGVCNVFPDGLVDPDNEPSGGMDTDGSVTNTALGVYTLLDPIAPGATVTFDIWLEVCEGVDVGTYTNTANLTWEDLSDDTDEAGDTYGDTDTAPLVLVEPEFEVTKGPEFDDSATHLWTADRDDPEDGLDPDEVFGGIWTITIENTGSMPIGGLNVNDVMPDPYLYTPTDASVVWFGQSASTFVDNSTADSPAHPEPLMAGMTDTLDFTVGQLMPGGEIQISVPFTHSGDDPADGELTRENTVTVTNDNIDFDPEDHSDTGYYTLIPIELGPKVAKTVSPASDTPEQGEESEPGAPGQQFDFAVEVTIPTRASSSTFDVWIRDDLPDGLMLVNEPATGSEPAAPTDGWLVSCVSGPCPALGNVAYLGSQAGAIDSSSTDMAWWFGDIDPDNTETPSTYLVTYRVEIEKTFDSGVEIIDGFDEPLINFVEPIFNRDLAFPGGTGDNVDGTPSTIPSPDDYERVYPKDPAEIDVVTPRLEIDKNVYDENGNEIREMTAGQVVSYEIIANNIGSGDAFDIDLDDTLGTPRDNFAPNWIEWDPASLSVSPAGVVCNTYVDVVFTSQEHLLCEFDGPLAPGQTITITYEGTTIDNDDFFSQNSSQNYDPMFIRNEVGALEYYEAANEGGNMYATGAAATRLLAYTPVAEIDGSCVGGKDILPNAPIGSTVQFYVVAGNGDRWDVNGNPDGDQTLTPPPTEDHDGDGFPDAGMGFNPEMRVAIQDKFTYVGTTATGPGAGDPTYTSYSPFAAPDEILDGDDDNDGDGDPDRPGTYILVWNDSLENIPHSPDHQSQGSFLPHTGNSAGAGDFLPHYELLIDVVKTEAGGGVIWFDLDLEDAAGNTDRGTAAGEYWEFHEGDRHGCPGGPPPQVWKTPDDTDGVVLTPGETTEFVIYIQQPADEPLAGTFEDLLPDGLMYRGDLLPTDDNYAEATIDTVPANWTDDLDGDGDVDLQDYFISSVTQGNGDTVISWEPPPLPKALASDPDAGDTDTRHVIRVPVIALDNPPYPNEFVVNQFTWDPDDWGPRKDTGAVLTESAGKPSITKRAADSTGLYGDKFQFTIEVVIPGGFSGKDVMVFDEINRQYDWQDPPNYAGFGQCGNNTLFPNDPQCPLQSLGEYGHYGTSYDYYPNIFPVASGPPLLDYYAGEYRTEHYLYHPAEFEFSNYISQTCISGCNDDPINLVPMAPLPHSDGPTTLPITWNSPELRNHNGALGWFLGDIDPPDGGQDRIIQLTYEVEAPSLLEQRNRIAELNPSNYAGGTDPAFDDVDSYWFEKLSQVNHPNVAYIVQFARDDTTAASEYEGGGPNDWQSGTNNWLADVVHPTQPGYHNPNMLKLAADDTHVTVSYPLVDMDKQCNSFGATDDSDPLIRPFGTPNVECTITLTNRSPVEAFDVTVNDTPLEECVLGAISYTGYVRYLDSATTTNPNANPIEDPNDPQVVTYPCPVSNLLPTASSQVSLNTGAGATFPVDWVVNLGPNATETLTYQFSIDGWTDLPNMSGLKTSGSWDQKGMWINYATMQPWADEPGGTPLGDLVEVQDDVGFREPVIDVHKFPYPDGRDLSEDARPFGNWLSDPDEQAAMYAWPFYYMGPDGQFNNPATWYMNSPHDYGDPYAGDYWMFNQPDADLLDPVQRGLTAYSWPWNFRGLALGVYPNSYNNWSSFGNAIADGSGWWHQPLDDPDSWADVFDADPTKPYTWSIDIRVDALGMLSEIKVEDQLPYGWTYVPGSAEIVDGSWYLGYQNGSSDASIAGRSVGYGTVPLPDPTQTGIGTGACTAPGDRNYHQNGETLTWDFERSGGGDGDYPWEYRYVDARDRVSDYLVDSTNPAHDSYIGIGEGASDKWNWVRIHYDAIPTNGSVAGVPSVFDCDPDTTSTEDYFMENNVEVTARRDVTPALASQAELTPVTYDMIAPVPNPLAFEKTPDSQFAPDESVQNFTITFTNDLDVPVEDLVIADDLRATPPPGGSGPLPGGGYTCLAATATANAVGFTETTCNGGNTASTQIEWTIDSIAPGETIEITIPIIIPKDEQNLLVWDNTARTTVKEWFDVEFEDDGQITVVNPSEPPLAKKSADPNPATINDVVTYEVIWEQQAQTVFMDLAYFDLVPDGLTFESHIDVTCTGGCPAGYSPSDVITMTPQVNPDGTTQLMWWFGDMPGSSKSAVWTMTYQVRVDDTYTGGNEVLDEDVLINTVTGYSSHENLLEDPRGLLNPEAWAKSEYKPSESSHNLAIEEPELAISKSATPNPGPPAPVDSSSTITYTVEIENVGGMDAYAIDVRDLPNGALENLVMLPTTYPGSVVTQGWTSVAPEVGWFIPVLSRGDTASFQYTAEVTNDFLIDGFSVAENDANIESFRARGGVDPEEGDRFYVGDEASVAVTLAGPDMSLEKFAGGCSDEFSPATVGDSTIWCLEFTNNGDATAYGAKLTDTLPVGWTYDAATTTGTGWTAIEPTITTPFTNVERLSWTVGDIAAKATLSVEFTATPGATSPQNVTNWATIETFTSDGDPLPATVTGARDSDPASAGLGTHFLEISKTPDEQQWAHIPDGGTVTWTISVANPHPTTSNTDLVVTDFLPAPLTYNTSTFSDPRVTVNNVGAPAAGAGGTQEITWDISDLQAGESIEIELTADVPGTVTQMLWYNNDVQVTSAEVSDQVVNQAKARFYEPASLGDHTWIDTNGDGEQGNDEPGLDGVTVNLLDGSGNQLYRDPATGLITTDASLGWPAMTMTSGDDPSTPGVEQGWYTFGDLPAGSYIVEFVPPAGLLPTKDNHIGDDAADSDANRFTGRSPVVALDWGDDDPTIDAGFIDEADYYAEIADVDIEKETNEVPADDPPGPSITTGDAVTWTYDVENTGWVALRNVTVTDSDPSVTVLCDTDDNGLFDERDSNVVPFIMLPGDTVACQATGVAGQGYYANNSTVAGDPVLPDFEACKCDPADPSTWPEEPTSYNPAEDGNGDPLPPETDEDPSHYFGSDGGIDLEKLTNGFQADDPTGPVVPVDGEVTWTYVVTNTSTTALTGVVVTDDPVQTIECEDWRDDVDGDNTIDLLLPTDVVTCTATGTATADQYRNDASTEGNPYLPDPETCGCQLDDPTSWPDDPDLYVPAVDDQGDPLPPVDDGDPSHYFGEQASVDIEKFTNDVQADIGPGPGIATGDEVTWTYQVTNDGNTPLSNAIVSDSDPSITVVCEEHRNDLGGDNIIALMLPGDVVTCSAIGTAEDGQYENDSDVSGDPVLPDPETCGCDLFDPSSWPDDPELYTPATTPVVDPITGEPVIDPETGEPVTEPVDPVVDEDPSHYYGTSGGIDIEKDTNGVQADVGPGPVVPVDGDVTWTYVVTNTSTTALADVTVSDSQGVDVECDTDDDGAFDNGSVIALMLPGAEVTCQGTGTAEAGQYENTGLVEGNPVLPDPSTCDCDPDDPSTWPQDPDLYDPAVDENGEPLPTIGDVDPSHYFGGEGGIDIEKSTNGEDADEGPGPIVAVGENVEWTYVVTNTSTSALTDVTVTDDQGVTVDCGDGTNLIALLLPGQSITCTGSGEATRGLYENLGEVSGDPALPDPEACGCDPSDPATWPTDPELYEPALDENGEPLPPETADDPSHYDGRAVDLELSKQAIDSSQTDNSVQWKLMVTNNGPDTAPAPIVVSDELPTGLTYKSADSEGWTCSADGQSVSCAYAEDLLDGEEAPELVIETAITAPLETKLSNAATVLSESLQRDLADNTGTGETDYSNNNDADTITVGDNPGPLAFTGQNVMTLVLLALVLATVGGLLMLFGRRRRMA